MLRRLKLYLSMVRYGNLHNEDFAREHYIFFERMLEDLKPHIGSVNGLRVLDVGCGKAIWLTLLLHSIGAKATGIDTEYVEAGLSFGKYLRIAKKNGFERALRTIAWDALYAKPYFSALAKVCSFPLNFKGVDARTMDVAAPMFDDETFDLIVSHEVFEHIEDPGKALKDLKRLMKPGAIAYIYIHNYTSLSGGHHIAWKYPDAEPSDTVPPWDHLRKNLYPEIPSWINRIRETEYKALFKEEFEILNWISGSREGEALLTSKIRGELSEYSEEELLTKGFAVIARPKKNLAPVETSE